MKPISNKALSFGRILIFGWVLVNAYALAAIAGAYIIACHEGAFQTPFSHDDLTFLENLASRQQLEKLVVDGDAALRGMSKAFLLILRTWLGVTLLNITCGGAYLVWNRRISRKQAVAPKE